MRFKTKAFLVLSMMLLLFPLCSQDLRTLVIEEEEIRLEWERYKISQGIDEDQISQEDLQLYQASLKDGLLIRKVIIQLAENKNLLPSDLEVEQIYESIRSTVPTQEEWKDLLENQYYTEESFRQYLKESEAVERYLDQEIKGTLFVSDHEVEQYYRSHPEEFTREGEQIPFEEIKESLTAFLMAQKSQKAVSDFMDKIRSAVVSTE